MVFKEIYAALDIADNEIRLVVGEFVQGRLNVLYANKQATTGIVQRVIVNQQEVITSIQELTSNAQEQLGFPIQRVVLGIPSIHIKTVTKRVNVFIDSTDGKIKKEQIQGGIKQLYATKLHDNVEVINLAGIRYILNGIVSREMPIGEPCDVLVLQADVICGNKDIIYDYAWCIEKAGLTIQDICLDVCAIAEESSILRRSKSKYVVIVDVNKTSTSLALYEKDKLLSSQILDVGYAYWISNIKQKYPLEENVIFELLRNSVSFDEFNDGSLIHMYNDNEQPITISNIQFYELLKENVTKWIEQVNGACEAIVNSGTTQYVLSGKGCEFACMEGILKHFNAPATAYVPEKIGVRNPIFTASLGMLYLWKSHSKLKITVDNCSDDQKIAAACILKRDDEEMGLTQKIKRFFTKNER